jgi:hypothetical protein
MWDGYQWREDRDNRIRAHFAAAQMSVHTKKPVKATDLYKPQKNKKSKAD